MKILPSLISSDLLNIQKTIEQLAPIADGFHIDIMDDHFVPNLTWGPMFVNAIKAITKRPLSVHLMVQRPESWLERIFLDKNDWFAFHYEVFGSSKACKSFIDAIHAKSWQAHIAINPETPVDKISGLLPHIQGVIVMSVNPGFSGQSFIEKTKEKIATLRALQEKNNYTFSICVDGGVSKENIAELARLGATHVGVAHAIFGQKDYVAAMQELQKKVN